MLGVASVLDVRTWRVPNSFIVLCSITSLYLLCTEQGVWGCFRFLIQFFWPVLLLYPVYLLGGMGSGDVKLLGVVSTLMNPREMLWVILVSIVIGAGMGLLGYIRKKQWVSKGIQWYVLGKNCYFNRQFSAFFQEVQNGKKIHFTLCILCAFVGWVCKEELW